MIALTRPGRERVFNLGYYAWVEQQQVSLGDFDRRRDPAFREGLMAKVPVRDQMIDAFNRSW